MSRIHNTERIVNRTVPVTRGNPLAAMIKHFEKKCRVVDPDPYWIRIQSGLWIRIRIRNPDPDPGGQK